MKAQPSVHLWEDDPPMLLPSLPLFLLLLLSAACTDRDAPRPVPVPDRDVADGSRPLSSRETLPPPAREARAPELAPRERVSYLSMVWRELRKNRISLMGVWCIGVLVLLATRSARARLEKIATASWLPVTPLPVASRSEGTTG